MNFYSDGGLIADAVTAHRHDDRLLLRPDRFRLRLVLPPRADRACANFMLRGLIPFLGGVMLFGGMILTVMPGLEAGQQLRRSSPSRAPHVQIGWAFLLGIGSVDRRADPAAHLDAGVQAVLPRRDAQPGHADLPGRRRADHRRADLPDSHEPRRPPPTTEIRRNQVSTDSCVCRTDDGILASRREVRPVTSRHRRRRLTTSRERSSSSCRRTAGGPTRRSARRSGCPRRPCGSGCRSSSTPASCRSSRSPIRCRSASPGRR